ncbi:MAG TPA: penicillin-binding transpeptidase domain-containing protein [Gemmatimonadales bacterium]|nr:penicillin-binding transpeptidase domain-containing protein [Gemmatimonadales bacterium]
MAKPAARIAAIQFGFALGVLAILTRAAQLQIVEAEHWQREAASQRTVTEILPARRGALYDRNGIPLAITQEFYHVGIAPNELQDVRGAFVLLVRSLGVSAPALNREFQARKRWIYLHGPFNATQVQPLRRVPGIHLEGEYQRFYPSRDLVRPIVGGLSAQKSTGAGGLEASLDSLLTGRPGEAVLLKDLAGRRYESPGRRTRDPVPGNDVTLTIDAELQEIAERGLDDAIAQMRAEGGDVVFLDPNSGELLALASRQAAGGGAPSASTFTDPFEPGSTAKLFTAAALLMRRRVKPTETVSGENGQWDMPTTSAGRVRRITDAHVVRGQLTLARAIQVSSNIAMAKFSSRLRPEEQFETLRDFGFGTPTSAEFPGESRGILAFPHRWQPMYTRASMAMGYEFAVTPVQLAAAYAAIANDGVLLAPTLVREVRDPGGNVLYRHRPEPVRRVVTSEVAAQLREFLREASGEGGTGELAQLANYSVLGKTGTAIRFVDGRYVRGQYTASFAAIFPADHPQLVVIVKIDNPSGNYYGGLTAAPVTRTMLQQALASRRVAIDRGRLAAPDTVAAAAKATLAVAPVGLAPVVVSLPFRRTEQDSASRPVPDVVGRSIREAALALHRRGFRVNLRGLGRVVRTMPAGGETERPGTSVMVLTE